MALQPAIEGTVTSSVGDAISIYLTEISIKDKPWDKHRAEASVIQTYYRGTDLHRYAERIDDCARMLGFNMNADEQGQIKLKLDSARFCRVRHCPVCQWRRALLWRAKFFQLIPGVLAAYPQARFLFLTLTIRNPQLEDLATTLQDMNKAWTRLTHRKDWPAQGWVKSVEVTRERDRQTGKFTGYVHPHFHVILMVKPSYFTGEKYLSQAKWTELWKESLRVDYSPRIDIRVVRPKSKKSAAATEEINQGLIDALTETLKYSVKPEDLIGEEPGVSLNQSFEQNQQFLLELTNQLHKTKAVAIGGVLKDFISGSDLTDPSNEALIHAADKGDIEPETIGKLYFAWHEIAKGYLLVHET